MSATLDKLVETLTADERNQLREMLNREAEIAARAERARLIKSIRGKYKHVITSSEAFAERKQQEIEIENRRFSTEAND